MSEFSSINKFGTLTVNGITLKFEDFDKNNNGEISVEEYNSVLKEMKLDAIELSTLDKNSDKTISNEEFSIWEQKILMQDAVNAMKSQISKDFAGKTQYLTELKESLTNLIEEFSSSYSGKTTNLANAFIEILPQKYEDIKNNLLANDPSTIKSKVIDEIYLQLSTTPDTTGTLLNETTLERIITELDKEAEKFVKSYKGSNLESDLKIHLDTYLNSSDAEIMNDAGTSFKTGVQGLGPIYDSNDLATIKEYAREFLQTAVDNGVNVKIGNAYIKTTNAITTALNKFTDAEELINTINNIINSLSIISKKEALIEEEKIKAQEAAEKAFTDISGSKYAIDANLIDYTQIEGYFEGEDISVKKKKKVAELKKIVIEEIRERLEALKSQMKEQIKTMLSEKGVLFEKIEQVFENVYSQTFIQTIESDGMISTKHRTAFHRGKASLNVKNCVDQFITNFNTNIANAIDEMNKSNKDFDIIDLDMSVIGTDENGTKIETANNDDILKAYQTGLPLTTKKRGADYYVKIAEQIIDGLKAQMLTKAKNMCKENNIEFDLNKFNTIFNNAKSYAINTAVTGVDSKRKLSGGGLVASSSGATVAGAAVATGTATEVIGGASLSAWTCSSAWATVGTFTIPVAGWIAGGALLVGGVLASIFSKTSSQSTLDTRTLIDVFTTTFKQSYTQMVESEVTEIREKES